MLPALVTAKRTEDRPCQKCGEERFGHNDPPEQKRTAKAEIDHACDKGAPVISEPLADQEDQRNRGDNCECHWQARRGRTYAEKFKRKNNKPVE